MEEAETYWAVGLKRIMFELAVAQVVHGVCTGKYALRFELQRGRVMNHGNTPVSLIQGPQ